jgi:hypothetical protein
MPELAHPGLRLRTKPNPHLRRPSSEHALLGKVIFNNKEPTWQTSDFEIVPGNKATYSFYLGREAARISAEELDVAANWLTLFRSNESSLRQQAGKSLVNGAYKELDLVPTATKNEPSAQTIADAMRLVSIELFPSSKGCATYDLLDLESHEFRGGHKVQLSVTPEATVDNTTLVGVSAYGLARLFLQRASDLGNPAYEIDSPADQIVSTIAYMGWLTLDDDLRSLIAKCVTETELRSNQESGATKRQLELLSWLLQQIAKVE